MKPLARCKCEAFSLLQSGFHFKSWTRPGIVLVFKWYTCNYNRISEFERVRVEFKVEAPLETSRRPRQPPCSGRDPRSTNNLCPQVATGTAGEPSPCPPNPQNLWFLANNLAFPVWQNSQKGGSYVHFSATCFWNSVKISWNHSKTFHQNRCETVGFDRSLQNMRTLFSGISAKLPKLLIRV